MQRPEYDMQAAPWMNVSNSISSPIAALIASICSNVISRASTTRFAPSALYTRADSLFVVLACVLTCTSSPGTSRAIRAIAPRSETIAASTPISRALCSVLTMPSRSPSKAKMFSVRFTCAPAACASRTASSSCFSSKLFACARRPYCFAPQ